MRSSIDAEPSFSIYLSLLLRRPSPASTLLRRDPTSAGPSAGRRRLLPAYRRHAGPRRPPRVRQLDVPPPSPPIPLRPRLDFWASRSLARQPGRPGLLRALLAFDTAAKGQRDRYVTLSPQLLELLRDWWRAARPQVWLFPGQNPINPVTARQLNRAVHAAKSLAGIPKRVSPHTLRHQLCDPPARTERRYPGDPGAARTCQARGDGGSTPAWRSARSATPRARWSGWAQPDEATAARFTTVGWRGPRIAVRRSPTSFAPMGRRGARPTPVT